MMNLPEEFIKNTKALMGETLYGELEEGLQQQPPVSIRMNPLKCAGATISKELADGCVAWSKDGVYLKTRPNFTFDPLLHAGAYYVQEASSMFVQHVIVHLLTSSRMEDGGLGMENTQQSIPQSSIPHPQSSKKLPSPLLVLDLCAAPGGKSTAVRAILPEGSVLISNEPIRQRAQILTENIMKFGHPDVIVTNNYAQDIARTGLLFDIIVCDVPCSGEGMFRKDEGAIGEWSEQNVENCSRLQCDIVSDIWGSLRPGGIMIYSTCTFNAKEDEENVEWIISELGAEIVDVPVDEAWNITGPLQGDRRVYRFLPGKTRGEGLFMAVLRKQDNGEDTERRKEKKEKDSRRERKNAKNASQANVEKEVSRWLSDADSFKTIVEGDRIVAIPRRWEDIYNKVKKSLCVLHAGITLGTLKGKNIIPSQSAALSTSLNVGAFACADIDYEQAINYLRRETITLSPDIPHGIVLLKYRGLPLGFVKNLGNRANNLYPQEWKIKSSHIPEEPEIIVNEG